MIMIPYIYHLTTRNGNLNPKELIIYKKNKELLGSDWKIVIYSDKDNERLLEKYYPEFIERFSKIKKGVVKADIMRCLYMHRFGGIYSDTDYRFLRPLPQKLLYSRCVIPAESIMPDTYTLCNCLFMSDPGIGFWYDFVDLTLTKLATIDIREEDIISTSGPIGITRFYQANKVKYNYIEITPPIMFFPLKHRWELLKKVSPNTYGVHYCLASWRNVPFVKRLIMNFVQNMQVKGLNFRKIK